MSEKGLVLLDANFVKSFSRESEILKFDLGRKRYLRICTFASATLQQNRTDTEKNTKDTV
jgi:hypothetical protein